MINKKILAPLLIGSIAVISVGSTYAWFHHTWRWAWMQNIELTDEQKAQIELHHSIMDKVRNWETLTDSEQATLNEIQNSTHRIWGWRWIEHMWGLTDTERATIENMTDDEIKAYIDWKMNEMKVKREKEEAVIDKLLAWEVLTNGEEAIRQEMIKDRAERKKESY